jgi:hypothetical protein
MIAAFAAIPPAAAGTLENMERERAIALDVLLAPEMAAADRQTKVALSKARLVDLERMALRDKSLQGRDTPLVRTAFENYDLTFLVHASTEKNKTLLDHWLDEVGISTHALMSTRVGRR